MIGGSGDGDRLVVARDVVIGDDVVNLGLYTLG
jgi:hypothetical protein